MKTVVITGATSFIGVNLIPRLKEKGYRVIGVVRPDSAKKEKIAPFCEIVEADMKDYDRLDQLIKAKVDICFSLAWAGTRGEARNEEARQRMNYEYLAEAVKSIYKLGCAKFVSAGSQAEYGNINEGIEESAAESPLTQYGIYKLKFYKYLEKFAGEKGISVKEPRFFSLYGPGDFSSTMVISMLVKMMRNEPCDLTECVQNWDFLYIDDAVDALIRLIEMDCQDGVYNFGSGVSRPLKGFVREMKKIAGSQSRLNFGAIPYPPTGMVSLAPNIAKLKKELHWEPKVSFAQGIEKVIETMKGEAHEILSNQ